DEQQLLPAGVDVPEVRGAVLTRGDERAAVGREAFGEDVAPVVKDAAGLAGAGVPDSRGVVIAAAGEQPSVGAEGEGVNPRLGEVSDNAARPRAEDRRGRRLRRPRRNGKDVPGRVEESCKHPVSELDALRAPCGEVEQADVSAARD